MSHQQPQPFNMADPVEGPAQQPQNQQQNQQQPMAANPDGKSHCGAVTGS